MELQRIGATRASRLGECVTHVEAPLSREPCPVDSKLNPNPPENSRGGERTATVNFTSIPSENVTLYWTRSVGSHTINCALARIRIDTPRSLDGVENREKAIERSCCLHKPADIINFLSQVIITDPYISFKKYGSEHDGYFVCFYGFMGRHVEVAARNKKICIRKATSALCTMLQLNGTHGSWTCTDDHDFDRTSVNLVATLNGDGNCPVCQRGFDLATAKRNPMWYVRAGANPCGHYMCRGCASSHACVEWTRDENPLPLGSSTCHACRALYHVPVNFVTRHADRTLVPGVLARAARDARVRARREGDPPGRDLVRDTDPPDTDDEPEEPGEDPPEEDPLEVYDGELYTRWNYLYLLPMLTSYGWLVAQGFMFALYLSSIRKSALMLTLLVAWSAPLYYTLFVLWKLNADRFGVYLFGRFTNTVKMVLFWIVVYTSLFSLVLYLISEPLFPILNFVRNYYGYMAVGAEILGMSYNLIGHLVLVSSRTAGIHQYSGSLMYGRPFWFGRPIIGIDGYRGVTSCRYYKRLCDQVYYEIRSGNKVHSELNRFIRADMARRVGDHTLVDPVTFSNSVLMLSQRIQTEGIIDPRVGEGGIGNVRY